MSEPMTDDDIERSMPMIERTPIARELLKVVRHYRALYEEAEKRAQGVEGRLATLHGELATVLGDIYWDEDMSMWAFYSEGAYERLKGLVEALATPPGSDGVGEGVEVVAVEEIPCFWMRLPTRGSQWHAFKEEAKQFRKVGYHVYTAQCGRNFKVRDITQEETEGPPPLGPVCPKCWPAGQRGRTQPPAPEQGGKAKEE